MSSSTTNNSERQSAIRQYNELIQVQQQLAQKITELESDRNEHSLVADTLEPLEPGRRAYRLVGEVLVERTVEEVLPSIKKNMENVRTSGY
jgi:prefoldin subunit 2